jgi:hypothetical protein
VPYAEVSGCGYIPVWRYVEKKANGKSTFYALPVGRYERNPDATPDMTLSAQSTMSRFVEGIRKRLKGWWEVE